MNLANIDASPISPDLINQVAAEMAGVWGFTPVIPTMPILWGLDVHPEGRPKGTKVECLKFEDGLIVIDFSSAEHATLPNIWHEVCHALQPRGMSDGRYVGNPAEIEAHCIGFSAELCQLGVADGQRKELVAAMTQAVGEPANLMPALIAMHPQKILQAFADGELAAVCLKFAELLTSQVAEHAAEFDEIAQRLRAL